jgi:predicted protein tyrosine phosphatase
MFDASKARRLTGEACGQGNAIFDEMMSRIETRITEIARLGKREIDDPFKQTAYGQRLSLSKDMMDSIRAEFVRRGFTWTHHPLPIRKGKQKMEIIVSSREAICGVIQRIQRNKPDNQLIVISITDPKSKPVDLPLFNFEILRLSFHDLDQTYPGHAIILFDTDMAHQIKSFVEERMDETLRAWDGLIIVVHCEAGISRSAAVAGALSKHFLGDDSKFFRTPYLPNRMVYRTLLNLLNGQENPVPNVIIDKDFEENNIFG